MDMEYKSKGSKINILNRNFSFRPSLNSIRSSYKGLFTTDCISVSKKKKYIKLSKLATDFINISLQRNKGMEYEFLAFFR